MFKRRRRIERARVEAGVLSVAPAGSDFAIAAISGRAGRMLLTLITDQDLLAEIAPDLLIDADEARLETDLRDVSRSGQIDLVGALDGSRAGGEGQR